MTELALVETKTGYVELDALVDAAEGDGIRARWEFGKAVLQERGESRLLPRGRTAEIAEMIGKAMSEVQARTNFAEEFPTEEKLSHAVREFGSWYAIRNRPRGEGRSTEPKPDPSADGQIMEHLEAVKKLIPKWEEGFRPLEVFNAALTAKNPQAVAIDRIVTSFDLRVAAGTTSGIAAVKRLERIYKDGGKSALESVLRVITQTWDPDEQHRFHGNMLLGMHLYLMREPSVNLERIVTRLKRTSPVDILRKARASAIGSDIAYATEREIREAVKRRNL